MSGIKSLFSFLMLEKIIEKIRPELIDNPRIGFKIPEVLSIQEIDSIIAAVDLSKKEGQRNRALLETLYSCGLRVSELITLKLSDLYLDDEFIRVEGKGQKQRLVPISKKQSRNSVLYGRPSFGYRQKGHEDFLFLSRRGTHLSRIMIFILLKSLQMRLVL